MKLLNTMISTAVLSSLALGAVPLVASAAPELTIQSERAAHPRLDRAVHDMQDALKELQAAPDDFGGNKGNAIRDTQAAIHSLKKALYYRLKMDDAAIDKVQ